MVKVKKCPRSAVESNTVEPASPSTPSPANRPTKSTAGAEDLEMRKRCVAAGGKE
jgi:hypothetical protein